MENLGYLFAAYSVIFVAIFLYVLFIWQRHAQLESEVRGMEERLRSLTSALEEAPRQPAKSES
jgi:CcmD family protein